MTRVRTASNVLAGTAILLTAAASVVGTFTPIPYAEEALGWAAQGRGQDAANLLFVVPAALLALFGASRDAVMPRLLGYGLLIYLVYSYLLYALFLHFQPTFLLYVATLGVSFYALVAGVLGERIADVTQPFAAMPLRRLLAGYLLVSGVLFAALWLAEILPATLAGGPLASAEEAGFWVNPVHVLDLAFVLPGMIAAGIFLLQRRSWAYAVAVPLTAFAVAMGTALVAMMISTARAGLPFAWPPALFIGASTATGAILLLAIGRAVGRGN